MENSITNSAFSFPQFLEEFLDGLKLEYFEPANAQLLQAVLKLYNEGKVINLDTLKLWLGEDFMTSPEVLKILESQIIPDYLNLKEDFKHYLFIKKQSWLSLQLARASRNGEIFNMELLNPYIQLEQNVKCLTLEDWLILYEQRPEIPKFSTGLEFLDTHLDGGFELGQLVLVGGDPEAGKTLLSVQIAEHMARFTKAAFYCYEFSVFKYIEVLKKRKVAFSLRDFFLDDEYPGFEEFIYHVKLLIKRGVKLFVIDSQQMIKHRLRGFSDEQAESEKFNVLQTMAKKYMILIILIVQNAKSESGKSSPSPFGSIKGAFLAHVYLQLTRPKSHECKWADIKQRYYIRKLTISKNKQTGRAGFIYFAVDTNKYRLIPCRSEQLPTNDQFSLPTDVLDEQDVGGADEQD
ncbi:DnaB-like helicase C-terminal domain-containing protein [Helicobacter suis]|uniref:DnaB-like helicase C-terminal domain-containing protein n=1 Tax=Helicobacter suis TaxID=104628 RepID=UPI0013D36228|nr:DnaB-like helicase C-terminal domain-containing protein [Helicobacter suis]